MDLTADAEAASQRSLTDFPTAVDPLHVLYLTHRVTLADSGKTD